MSTRLNLLLSALLLFSLCSHAEIISSDRRTTWQGVVGIPDGIPNRTTIFADVTDSPYNAVGDGVNDDTAEIQAALDACTSNQVVYLPAGTYLISSPLKVKNFTTVRGAGTNSTTIKKSNASSQAFRFGSLERYYNDGASSYYDVSGSPAAGTTTITLSGTLGAEMVVGNLITIDQLNDGDLPLADDLVTINADGQTCTHCSRSSGTRVLMQTSEITAVSGNDVTFSPGLYYGRDSALSPQAFSLGLNGQWAGVEDLKVTASTASGGNNNGASFHFEVNKYCWAKSVEGDFTNGDHVEMNATFRCEVRDSYFHDGYAHGPGQAEAAGLGIAFGSGNLYENNIVRRSHVPIYINWGAAGNVIGYNFATNSYNTANPHIFFGGLLWHGAHPMMNLIEGNIVTRIFQDGVWGSASHETMLRNWITSSDNHIPPYDTYGAESGTVSWPYYAHFGVYLAFQTRNFNFVGNVVGSEVGRTNWSSVLGPGNGTGVEKSNISIPPTDYSAYQTASWLWVAGYSSVGGDHTEDEAWETTLNHGNWNAVLQDVEWDGTIMDQDIPDSYYLTSKPSWWPAENAWPAIDPDSPLTAWNPAMGRWTGAEGPAEASAATTGGGRVRGFIIGGGIP